MSVYKARYFMDLYDDASVVAAGWFVLTKEDIKIWNPIG